MLILMGNMKMGINYHLLNFSDTSTTNQKSSISLRIFTHNWLKLLPSQLNLYTVNWHLTRKIIILRFLDWISWLIATLSPTWSK
jgi:hypothetical protein